MSLVLSCVPSFVMLPGCSGDGGGDKLDGGSPGLVDMSGAIQKGPFIVGADVVVAMLDPATADPIGANFPTTRRNDFGEFDLMLPGPR